MLCSDRTEVNISFDIDFNGKSPWFVVKTNVYFLFALHDKPMKTYYLLSGTSIYIYAIYIRVVPLQSLYNAFCAVCDFSFGQGYEGSKSVVSPCGALLVFINKIK